MRFVRESDSADPEDARTVEIQPEDLLEFRPVRRYLDDQTADALAAGGTLEPTYQPSAWDWLRFAAPWLGLSTVIAAILLLVLEILAPWK